MQILQSKWAARPPMGWNSWDCFGVNVTEEEVRQNADFMARHLKQYGWEYIIVDLGWYAPEATKDNYKDKNIPFLLDDVGRLIPDPKRFPSSANGKGFKPLADYVHSLGLKFGIHIMRGMPWNAAEQQLPIKGSNQHCGEVAVPEDMCLWYNSMYGIDISQAGGQAYYDSLIELYDSWDVDFIKADDMNAWDGEGKLSFYRTDEVEALSRAIAANGRPMVLSLSPGAAYTGNTAHMQRHAHMWRISCDFWDDWSALKRQFERCARWAPRIKAGHWPDADMLPFGGIGIRGEVGEERQTYFNEAELYTLMSLWCIFRSPLMYGGHLPQSDDFAIKLISNPEVLAVNQNSSNNREIYRTDTEALWMADIPGEPSTHYLGVFNLGDEEQTLTIDLATLGLTGEYRIRDLWQRRECGSSTAIQTTLAAHGGTLLKIQA